MDSWSEAFEASWSGPVAEVAGLPELALTGLVITLVHSARKEIRDKLAAVLSPLCGRLDVNHVGLRSWLVPRKTRWPIKVRATRSRVEVRAKAKLKPRQIRDLVEALAEVPGAAELRVRGTVRRFGRLDAPDPAE